MPAFAARLYDRMMSGPASSAHYADMARDLTAQGVGRRLLDVGTGPGRLLGEIRKLDDSVELHGLDLSSAMVDLATRKLDGQAVSLHAGSIRRTEFASDFFDVVTCAGSFYLWDEPAACLAEIHRILAPGGAAYLYETLRDCNRQAFEAALRDNLRREPLLRRLLAPRFLRKQLRMTYTAEEIRSIAAQTPFAGSATVTPISLGGLPVWARIELRRAKAS
jgi:ubiquinone/menaquinone biosynthesis C-methylase UbiE